MLRNFGVPARTNLEMDVTVRRDIKETSYNNSILVNSLIKSLSPKLKTSLIGVDLLGALNTYINIINKRYNNILRLILKSAP